MNPFFFFLLILLVMQPAQAQLRLPGLPGLPQPLQRLPENLQQRVDERLSATDLTGLRLSLAAQRLRRDPQILALDPRGELMLRDQLLAQPSSPDARDKLLTLPGLRIIEETRLDGLELAWLRLAVDASMGLPALLAQLRALDPGGHYDYHHVYLASGTAANPEQTPVAGIGSPTAAQATDARVGLIDSGIDATHPALRDIPLRRQGCAGQPRPALHGTAVASLLVGRDGKFHGALPGGRLYAADVYCDAVDGGSVQAIAQALAWLTREQVAVINISLVGPDNALLQRAIQAAQAKGHLIVAAVGNDGPAAPPLYPAAWPGVVSVTGVDARHRVLAEAGRRPMLAAPGSELAGAAARDPGYLPLRGTSFAAPLVAGLLAARLSRPEPVRAAEALASLLREARDLGTMGTDPIYGHGLVGERLAVAPEQLHMARTRR